MVNTMRIVLYEIEKEDVMTNSIQLGKNGKFGEIDFSKLKSGITKEEICGDDAELKSIFDKIDIETPDGKLDRNELQKFIEKIKELAAQKGEEANLSKSEAKAFDKENGKAGRDILLRFLNKLSSLTAGIENVKVANDHREIVTYSDGHTEEIFPDGSKILTVKNNGKTTESRYDKDGNLTGETVTEENGDEVITSYNNGKKVSQKSIASNSNKTILVVYDEAGNPARETIEDTASGVVAEYVYKNGQKELKKYTNTQTGEVITYDNENNTSESVITNGNTRTVTKMRGGQPTRKTITDTLENNSQRVSDTVYDGKNTTTNVSIDGKNVSQTKVINGHTYKVEYDGNGNTTGIIVQNGESIEQIAKNFNCKVEDLIRVNAEKVKGHYPNAYFCVGEEIKIPREIQADESVFQGRATKEEALNAYRIDEERKIAARRAAQEAAEAEAETQRAQERKQEQAEREREAKNIAQRFYDIADNNSGITSMNKMQELLDTEVNANNIVDILLAYQDPEIRKKDSSIIDTVISEVGASCSDKQRKVLMTILDKLTEAARKAGVSESDIENCRKAFVDSLNEEFGAKLRRTNPKNMEKALDALMRAILAKQNEVENVDEDEAMKSVAEGYKAENDTATEEFETARENDKWTSKMGDTICGWFGCNTVEDLRAKLGDNAQKVEKLIDAANKGDKAEFKRIYKDLFGIEFDPNKIAAAQEYGAKFEMAVSAHVTINNINEILNSNCTSYEELTGLVKEKLGWDEETLAEALEQAAAESGKTIETDEDKLDLLKEILEISKANAQATMDFVSDGKSIERMAKEAEQLALAAYGTNDIAKDVTQFNENMIYTEMITEAGCEIIGTIALQFVPGLGQVAAAKLALSAARWGVKGAKVVKIAKKAHKFCKNVKRFQQGKKFTSGVANRGAQITSQMVSAGAATAGVEASEGKDGKTVLRKVLMNMSFAGAGAGSSMLAPKLMQAFGITNRALANEIAEEIINAAASYGITKISGDDYGSEDAFIDFATGIIMSRLGHIKASGNSHGAHVDASKPHADYVPPKGKNPEGIVPENAQRMKDGTARHVSDNGQGVTTTDTYYFDRDGNVIGQEVDINGEKTYLDADGKAVSESEFNVIKQQHQEGMNPKPAGEVSRAEEGSNPKPAEETSKTEGVKSEVDKDSMSAKERRKAERAERKEARREERAERREAREAEKAQKSADVHKMRELKNKLGSKLYSVYESVERGIKNLRNMADFNKLSLVIKSKFKEFSDVMNDLLQKLKTKAKSIGLNIKANGINPLDKYTRSKKGIDMSKSHDGWFKSRKDLFGDNHDYSGAVWSGYTPKDRHHGAWKMHLFSVSEADWREMCDVIIPYLKEHDVDWKTFNAASAADCLNGSKQQGKAFTIYPKNNEDMAQIARDLDYIIRKNKLETTGSHITGDNQMGSTGRLFYRYEFNSKEHMNEILDLSPDSKDWNKYIQRDKYGRQIGGYYDANRGEGKYLADDMTLEDDIWRNFDPSDPNAKPSTSSSAQSGNTRTARLQKGQPFEIQGPAKLNLANTVEIDLNDPGIKSIIDNLPEGGRLTIGREGNIQINDSSNRISRVHVIIEKRNGKLYVIDNSTNGTTVIKNTDANSSSKAHNSNSAGDNTDPIKERAYSRFDKNATPEKMPNNGYLDQKSQYILNPNEMPALRLIDGTIVDLNSPEIRNAIANLKDGEYLTLGRNGDIEVSSSSNISRHHIIIAKENGQIQLKDVSTFGGTKALSQSERGLRADAIRKFDKNSTTVELTDNTPINQNLNYILDFTNLPKLRLFDGTIIDLNNPKYYNAIKHLREGGFITLGRTGSADIGISSSNTISRHHILLTIQDGELIMKDISSNGGTYRVGDKNGSSRAGESNESGRSGRSDGANNSNKAKNLNETKIKEYKEILGIPEDEPLTEKTLNKAYRKQANKWHPDKHSGESPEKIAEAEEMFKKIAEAKDALSKLIVK